MTKLGSLVDTDWLFSHLEDERLRIYDTSIFLARDPGGRRPYKIESGIEAYRETHIPGAAFLDVIEELSDRHDPVPFMMPAFPDFAATLGARGVSDDSLVVLYSARSMMWSTRVWWMLRAAGFDNAAVLDGGFDKWQREGRVVSDEESSYPAAGFGLRPRPELFVSKDEVAVLLDDDATCIVNALSPEMYAGSAAYDYGRPGHLPHSVNVHYDSLLDPETGTYLAAPELRRRFESSGVLVADRAITYCGGGISATMDALALVMLGHPDVAVYDGSLWEWAGDPEMPLVTGSEP